MADKDYQPGDDLDEGEEDEDYEEVDEDVSAEEEEGGEEEMELDSDEEEGKHNTDSEDTVILAAKETNNPPIKRTLRPRAGRLPSYKPKVIALNDGENEVFHLTPQDKVGTSAKKNGRKIIATMEAGGAASEAPKRKEVAMRSKDVANIVTHKKFAKVNLC